MKLQTSYLMRDFNKMSRNLLSRCISQNGSAIIGLTLKSIGVNIFIELVFVMLHVLLTNLFLCNLSSLQRLLVLHLKSIIKFLISETVSVQLYYISELFHQFMKFVLIVFFKVSPCSIYCIMFVQCFASITATLPLSASFTTIFLSDFSLFS